MTAIERRWIAIRPHLIEDAKARSILRRVVRRLVAVGSNDAPARTIGAVREEESALAIAVNATWAADLVLCVNVLCDLCSQGWSLRLDRHGIAAQLPTTSGRTVRDDKERIRAAHIVERDAQLRQPSVRKFIREMERRRSVRGEWRSIFSLMRDGSELAEQLRSVARLPLRERSNQWRTVIDPYLQEVTPGAVCAFTEIALADIWRYFRHTWTTTYQNTPGRKIFFIVRDRAAPCHPVIGIAALGSSIVQLSVRDEWIGWTGSRLVATMREDPTALWAKWIQRSLSDLIGGLFVDDFLQNGELKKQDLEKPTREIVARLAKMAVEERKVHRLYPARGLHKKVSAAEARDNWQQQARTHLFRSKRAAALAELLEARRRLQSAGFTRASAKHLQRALADPDAIPAIVAILRRIKAAHVGVDMMDITVCGAVAPYNRILGGKLVSLLMASPAVTRSYNRRYLGASSVIASSMAGKAVKRKPHLVLLGTTSLYGVGASQYNRLRMPAAVAPGTSECELAYISLGKTAGYGSYHFSTDTMRSVDPVLRRLQNGRPVNSIFGEGVNPKLRKVRSALDAVGLASDLLLQHGSPRLVYCVPLAKNFRDILIGRSRKPQYLLSDRVSPESDIVSFWCDRWLARRIDNLEVIADLSVHTLAYPVQHGARVALPDTDDETGLLFDIALFTHPRNLTLASTKLGSSVRPYRREG